MQQAAHQAFDTMQSALGGTPLGGNPLGGSPLGGSPLGGTPQDTGRAVDGVEVAHGTGDATRLPGLSHLGTDLLKTSGSTGAGDAFFIGTMHSDDMEAKGASGLLHCRRDAVVQDGHPSGMRCRMLARDAVDFRLEAVRARPQGTWAQSQPPPGTWDPAAPLQSAGPYRVRAVEVHLLMASPEDWGALAPQPQNLAFYRNKDGSPGIFSASDRRLYRTFRTVLHVHEPLQ
ncbi:hypothetical protein [Delftia sp. PS-11]|uniref:hypothetical protein n=1 Tax=Delftia sp. PS-11 TaxID=2767222 RepID=UPI0024603DD0|nr:hypothetical protein H9T68_06760 [Delftia sp. PS-11]